LRTPTEGGKSSPQQEKLNFCLGDPGAQRRVVTRVKRGSGEMF